MAYEIILSPEAHMDLRSLTASQRREVLDAIESHLRHEPELISQSRIKRLRGVKWPQYRLRIGDIRAFYDVVTESQGGIVEVLAVREKGEAMKWLSEYGERDDSSTVE